MNYILKGNIYYSTSRHHVQMHENAYLPCIDGKSVGVFASLPTEYAPLPLYDFSGKTIIPGLIDLHTHASQYAFRGLGMDSELLEWLNTHAFAEEGKFHDLGYAEKAYRCFVMDIKQSATTRACIFATSHKEATLLLMHMLEETGLQTYVGKVSMDRNAPQSIMEASAHTSTQETLDWIKQCRHLQNTKAILTPRFIPACSADIMSDLRDIFEAYALPLQSHLSENKQEMALVQRLCPASKFYGDAYNSYKLFGKDIPTIMAHCVHSCYEEVELMRKNKVFVAHCPQSNTNLTSGIAPITYYLDKNLHVGLGSDIGAGSTLSLFRAMVDAIQVSKLRHVLVDSTLAPLTVNEAFYLGTKGGGAFFGKVGSFEEGYEFDAIVIDDAQIQHPQELTLAQRLERVIYLSDDRHILAKFVQGKNIF